MHQFKELEIWKRSRRFCSEIYDITSSFPDNEKFGLTNQLRRASVSISSNIAEGSSRKSNKDFSRFLEIAIGSCYEIETQLLIAEAVNFGENDKRTDLLKEIDEEQKMIMSFMKKLQA